MLIDTTSCALVGEGGGSGYVENYSRINFRLTRDEVAQIENTFYPTHPTGEDRIRFFLSLQ